MDSKGVPGSLGLYLSIAASVSLFPALNSLKLALLAIWIIAKFSIIPQLLYVVILQNSTYQDMETQASSLLDLIRSNTVAPAIIQSALRQLKADIKHKHVPQQAVASIFDIVRLALVPTEYLDLGFSTLTHLTKRLLQQRQIPLLESQTRRTTPLLYELLDHEKERIRSRAVQVLAEFCTINVGIYNNVETILRDDGLRSGSSKIIGAVCEWIIRMHQENILDNLRTLSFISPLVECLRSTEANVSTAAKNALIELFRTMDDQDKDELRFKLRQRRIPDATIGDITAQITTSGSIIASHPAELETPVVKPRPVSRHVPRPVAPEIKALPAQDLSIITLPPDTVHPLSYSPEPSTAEVEASKIDPLYVESAKDLEAMFAEMLPYFAGKETEQNWTRREQSALKIRRITRGNAPEKFLSQYTAGIKSMVDGLVKGCNSLRTSLSTATCHCVQDIARKLKHGLDPMVEVLLQCLLKLCAATKKLASASGNACVAEILSNVTFTSRIGQHLLDATQDKNVQPRLYASKWLMIILSRYGRQRAHLDHHSDNLVTAITKGINDRDKDVREAMRPTFWAFARLWNDKSKSILSKMDKKQQELLLSDAANPFPSDWFTTSSSAPNAPAKATSSAKPSIKEAIAQKRLQKKEPFDRPGSAAEIATPARDVSARVPARPKSSLMTTRRPALASSTGSMSSAPVRPIRPVRKAEAKPDAKVGPLPHTRIHETPAARPNRFFEARTPAKATTKPAPTPKVEPVPVTEPTAAAPNPQKRVSWSEDDVPLEFYSNRPANEVGFASIDKPPTNPVDTITRNPDAGKAMNSVDEIDTSHHSDHTNRSDRPMFRCPSDDRHATLPVEPSGFLDSEASHFSVDGTFNIPAPEVAALSRARLPRRSSLKSSNRPDLSKEHQASGEVSSTTTYDHSDNTAPTSIEDRSRTPEYGMAKRLSQSPRPPASRKEGTRINVDSRRLRVYEDDNKTTGDPWLEVACESPPLPSTNGPVAVLSEIPINTENSKRRNSFSAKTITNENIAFHRTRQMIGSAIPRIQEGTLEYEGFRNLRQLIYQDNTWTTGDEGQTMFDELVLSFTSVLEGTSSYANMAFEKLQRLRDQVIHTLKVLNLKNKVDLGKWGLRIVGSLIQARADYADNARIVYVIWDLAKTLVDQADQRACLDKLLVTVEAKMNVEAELTALCMALELLTIPISKGNCGIDTFIEGRLGSVACWGMMSFETDVRMAATDLATKMFDFVKPESRYWALMLDLSDEHRNLITYYLSKV